MIEAAPIATATGELRYEAKYLVPREVRTALRCDLAAMLRPDPNAAHSPDGYRVESLYFDTPRRANYTEKLDGIAVRRKFRIRQYDDDSSTRNLEVKERIADRQRKARTALSANEYRSIVSGGTLYTTDYASRSFTVTRAMSALRPWLLLRYQRMAFNANARDDVRVTIDGRLEARAAHAFERPISAYVPVIAPGHAIVEFKWSTVFPMELQSLLRKYGLRNAALSKYCLGMDALVRAGCLPDV